MKNCADCWYLCSEGASMDYPYPSFWCGAGVWDGVADPDELCEEIECDFWEPK